MRPVCCVGLLLRRLFACRFVLIVALFFVVLKGVFWFLLSSVFAFPFFCFLRMLVDACLSCFFFSLAGTVRVRGDERQSNSGIDNRERDVLFLFFVLLGWGTSVHPALRLPIEILEQHPLEYFAAALGPLASVKCRGR